MKIENFNSIEDLFRKYFLDEKIIVRLVGNRELNQYNKIYNLLVPDNYKSTGYNETKFTDNINFKISGHIYASITHIGSRDEILQKGYTIINFEDIKKVIKKYYNEKV